MQDTKPFRFHDNPWIWFFILIAVSFFRLIVAANHLLFETECYYWMYNHYLDWGFFDHPPVLGIFLRLFHFWDPPSSLAARLHSVVGHFFCSLFLYAYARNQFHSVQAGIRTAVLFNVIPIYSILAIQNQPDTPLLFFWCATLFCFERSLATGKPGWWLLSGLMAGGALMSKFHAVPLAGSLILHLLFFNKDRRHLATPWPYLACILAVVCYVPNIWWNAQHGWITYRFQLLDHATSNEFKPVHLFGVLFAPFLLLSPWGYGYLIQTAARASRRCIKDEHRSMALGFWSSVPLFLFFVLISFSKSIKVHWTAPVFIGLLPLMAMGLESWTIRLRKLFYTSTATISLLIYLYLVYPYPISLTLPDSWLPSAFKQWAAERSITDWAAHLYGFDQLGTFLKDKIEAKESGEFDLIESDRFDRAAMAAYYAGYPDRAFVPSFGDRRGYILWPSRYAQPGANALYVFIEQQSRSRKVKELDSLRNDYETVGDPFIVDATCEGFPFRQFKVYPCYGLKNEALDRLKSPEAMDTR